MSETFTDSEIALGKVAHDTFIKEWGTPTQVITWEESPAEVQEVWIAVARAVCAGFMAANTGRVKEVVAAPKSPFFGLGIGRMVHYVDTFGVHCAATVVAIINKEAGIVVLAVHLLRGANEVELIYPASVEYDSDASKPRSWHWPEFVE